MPQPARADESRAGRFDRDEALGRLAAESFDVLVIGGGITGAGVALDAASRGLRTALVEKDDFASGTSSKSSKLIHGGLRYLQQHEYRLVYENLAERQRLLENAPHLVSPLPFLIPLFGRDGVVNRSVARVYLTALWLYDLTGGMRIGRRHEKVSRAQALAHLPTLRADRLVAGFLYWDARADDARLTLAVVRTAVLDHGAVAANHTPVTGLVTGPDGRVCGARVAPDGAEPFEIRASVVVNAAGRVVRRGADPRRAPRPALHPPGQGDPHHRAQRGLPVRHRRRHPGPGGPPVHLRGVVGRPGLPGHHRHRVRRAPRRPELPARGRRLHPRRGQRHHHPPHRPRRHHRTVDRAAAAAGPGGGEARPERAHRRPVPPPHRADLGVRGGHGDRREADHLPEDGRGHRGRGGRGPGPAVAPLRDQGPPAAGGRARRPGCRPRPRGRIGRVRDPVAGPTGPPPPPPTWPAGTARRPPTCWPWPTTGPSCSTRWSAGLHYLGVEALYAVRHEMAGSVADVLDRRTRASLRDARGAAAAARRVAELIGPELGWDETRMDGRGRGLRRGAVGPSSPGPDSTPTAGGAGRDGAAAGGAGTPPAESPDDPAHPGDGHRRRRRRGDRPPGRPAGGGGRAPCRPGCPTSAPRSPPATRTGPRPGGTGGRWPSAGRRPGQVPARPAVVARPTDTAQVAAVLALCHEARVPVTPAGGRSGVCGASVPLFGGVALDLCGLAGIGEVDDRLAGGRPPGRHLRPRRGVRAAGRATASPSGTGPSPWTCPRWAAGWPAGAPASTPTGTGRSRTWSSASRWCWPTAGWSAPAATGPGRPPDPT